jgi:hypothetical protein
LLGAMTRPVPSLGEVAALPRSVVAIVDRALAFDRTQRFPDARSMQLAVLAAREELGGGPDSRGTLPPSSVAPMSLPPRPSRTPLGPAVALEPERRSALPLYVGLGFAVGIGIVVAAQLTVHGGAPVSPVPAAPPVLSLPPPPAPLSRPPPVGAGAPTDNGTAPPTDNGTAPPTDNETAATPQPSGSASALSSARALPSNSK